MKLFELLKRLFRRKPKAVPETLDEGLITLDEQEEPKYLSEGKVSLLIEEMFARGKLDAQEAVKATDPRSRTEELQNKIQDFFESHEWITRIPPKPSSERDITHEGPVVLEQYPHGTKVIGYHFGRYPRPDSKDRLKGSKAVEQQQKKKFRRKNEPSQKEKLLAERSQIQEKLNEIDEKLKGLE